MILYKLRQIKHINFNKYFEVYFFRYLDTRRIIIYNTFYIIIKYLTFNSKILNLSKYFSFCKINQINF